MDILLQATQVGQKNVEGGMISWTCMPLLNWLIQMLGTQKKW